MTGSGEVAAGVLNEAMIVDFSGEEDVTKAELLVLRGMGLTEASVSMLHVRVRVGATCCRSRLTLSCLHGGVYRRSGRRRASPHCHCRTTRCASWRCLAPHCRCSLSST